MKAWLQSVCKVVSDSRTTNNHHDLVRLRLESGCAHPGFDGKMPGHEIAGVHKTRYIQ